MDAILGTCVGYKIRQIKPFVLSARAFTSARIILCVDRLSGKTMSWLRANEVETIPYRDNGMHMMQARFYTYCEYLKNAPYERVFLTDVADVLFQGELFTGRLAASGLHVFQEDPSIPIGKDRYNSEWIRAVYGAEGLAQVADKTIICAGTILGDIRAIRLYLEVMLREIEAQAGRGEQALKIGMDQGVHNYLAYTGEIGRRLEEAGMSLTIHPNGDGVCTTGLIKKMLIDVNNQLLNDTGEVVPAVHQYDRVPLLRHMFKQKYFRKEDKILYRIRRYLKKMFLLR